MSDLPAIPGNDHLRNVCRIGQRAACCRYVVAGKKIACAKGSDLQHVIDARVERMSAQSDNCSGPPIFTER